MNTQLLAAAALLPTLLAATAAIAAAPVPSATALHAPANTDAQTRAFWTADRLRTAKPLDMQVRGVPHGHLPPLRGGQHGARMVFPGAAPTLADDGSLAATLWADDEAPAHGDVHAPLSGGSGLPYTTNRLYPRADSFKAFPYAAVGHLFFTINGNGYQCSASVIRRNVILTAGHCVNDGNGNYYANWMFVPAQNGAHAPYGTWTWADADTTTAWYYGGGGVPNQQDDAVIVLNQNTVRGTPRSIGDLTGYFGYEFNTPLPLAVTQIGYPCNLDSCSDPIATYTQDTAGPSNNFEWGTYSYGGASGGPEVQDFGQAPSGVPSEPYGGNIVVSATSYTYSSDYEVDGGSVLWAPGQNGQWTFGDLINWACGFSNAC